MWNLSRGNHKDIGKTLSRSFWSFYYLTLKKFNTLPWFFQCWLWTSKYRLGWLSKWEPVIKISFIHSLIVIRIVDAYFLLFFSIKIKMKPVTIISPLLTRNFTSNNTDSYPASIFLLASFYSIVAVCGLIGNFLVVLIIWKNKDILGSSFGVYLFGSALTGFSVSIFCLPAYITLTPIFTEHPTGIAGEGKCKTMSAYVIVNYVEDFSMFTLTVISSERYAAVCKPLSTYAYSTTKRAKLTLCAECMICTLPIIPHIIG